MQTAILLLVLILTPVAPVTSVLRAQDSTTSHTTSAIPDSAWLTVHFVDVGQGDGIWIHTFDGRNAVIDGGPDASDSKNAMLQYLLGHGMHEGARIDGLVITHPHNDHYPGARGILNHFKVQNYYDPGYPKEGVDYNDFLNLARSKSTHAYVGKNNFQPLNLGADVKVEFLYAYPDSNTGLGDGNTLENNASIVMKLTYGKHTFLFMGDAEGKTRNDTPNESYFVEKILLDTYPGTALHATVLKIAHHGSETSSTYPFMNAVRPDVVVISSGRKAFGGTYLPDKTVIKRYCAMSNHPRVYRTDYRDAVEGRTTSTDTDGDHIVIQTNGRVLRITAYSAGSKTPGQKSACAQ